MVHFYLKEHTGTIDVDDFENNYIKAVDDINTIINILKYGKEKDVEPARLESDYRALFDKETFCDMVEKAKKYMLTYAIIALPGVNGLNAAEHLRSLCPTCRIIWCSDLDFSLHAFRLRADFFLLKPVSEEAFQQGLNTWIK